VILARFSDQLFVTGLLRDLAWNGSLMGRFVSLVLCFFISASVFLAARESSAALGESVDSIEMDRKALAGVARTVTPSTGYTVHEIDTGSSRIREYVLPSGIIFAIAWNGLTHPDLSQLLGSYAGQYEEALSLSPREHGRRKKTVKTDGIVVEQWGHMRNLRGRAYLPNLVPPGLRVDEIK